MADSTSDTPVNIPINPTNPSTDASGSADVKPAIKITLKKTDAPAGIPTANVVDNTPAPTPADVNLQEAAPAAPSSTPTIQLKKPESSTPTIQLKKPESSTPTIQLKKPESSTPTIQLKKPESSTPTIQLKKPENESASEAAPAKKVGEAPIPPERKLTLKLKNQPASTPPPAEKEEEKKDDAAAAPATPPPERKLTLKLKNQPAKPQELPRNLIPGLNIPSTPPPIGKAEDDQKNEAETQQPQQPPVAAPVETQTPVPEAATDGKKKKGKLPKLKKQPAPPSSADEPNWFFLTLSCLVLIAVCFIAYLLFAQYMNMYEEMQIPVPGFLMPK